MHINATINSEGRVWVGTARRRVGMSWAVLGLDNKLIILARYDTMYRPRREI